MFSDVQISWYKKQQKYMKYRGVGEDINIWYSMISLAENLNITGLLLDNGHLDLLSSSILAEIPPLGWARFCIGIYNIKRKSQIFSIFDNLTSYLVIKIVDYIRWGEFSLEDQCCWCSHFHLKKNSRVF